MKKIISLLILTVLCFAMLTSCDAVDTVKGWFGMGEEEVSTGLSEADVYLHKLYVNKDGSKVTLDFDVVGKVPGAGKFLNVTWTSDNEKVQIVNSTTAGYYTVDLPSVNEEEFTFKLTATITDEKGETKVRTYSFIMGKVDTNAIITEPEEGVEYKLFLTQATLGKRFYALATTQNNENKFINTTTKPTDGVIFQVEKVDGGYKFYTTVDGVKNYIYAKTTTNGTKVSKYLGFSTEDGSVLTYNAELGGVWTVTIDGYAYGIGTYNDFQTISLSEGKYFSATANGSSQFVMQVVTAEYANAQTEDKDLETYDDAATILDLLYALEDGKTMAGNFYFTGKITELDNYGNPTIVAEGHEDRPVLCYYLTDERFEVGATIKVYARTIKNYKGTYEFDNCELKSFTAPGGEGETPSTPSTTIGVVDTPVVGTAYKFGMVQANVNNTIYYLAGGMAQTYYLATTDDINAALDVYLEEANGGYYLYVLNGETKSYINMVVSDDGEHVNGAYEATASTVYTYNAESKTVIAVINEVEYWFGTRNDKSYTTVGPCAVSYAGFYCQFYGAVEGGDNEGGEGETPSTPSTTIGVVDTPVVGTAYKFGMVQANVNNTIYYLAGGMAQTYYLATTDDINAALDVYLEEANGGYYLYVLNGETKSYINMVVSDDGEHVNGAYEATASTVYTYNAESKTVIAVINEVEYWFGTRNDKSYTTVGPCAVSYAGFYCQFYGAVEGGDNEGGDNEGGEGETPSTPSAVTTIPDALAAADGTAAVINGIVISAEAWNTEHNNMSVTIKDANGNTIYLFRLATQVGLGDDITVTGTVGSYNNTKQIAAGATAVINTVHGDNHTYENGKCTVCETAQPVEGTKVQNCDFSTVSGTQYADESNTFGDVVVSTHNKGCHFNTQLRIYASDTNNGYAVVKATGVISSLVVNAGYKAATLEVYGSTDGETWTLIENVSTTTSYANHTVDIDASLGYTYLKLDATGAQIRVASISVTYAN